ncbi:MAG: DinB family protein [Actinomycetota bacterium]
MTEHERLTLESIAEDPEIGRWLAAFEEVRNDTLKVLGELSADAAEREPPDGGDGLGTVLYHLALVEVDWIFSDVLGREADIPPDLFPFDSRVEDGRLTPVLGESLERHLDRLARTRTLALDVLRSMSAEDYHRVRPGERFDVAADWVVFHLIDHEVEHRVRLSALRDAFRTDD